MLLLSCIHKSPAAKHSSGSNSWTQDATAHFSFKAQRGVRSEKKLKAIGEQMEAIQQELLIMLNETERQKLIIYFLKDRQTLSAYTGFPANGYTNTGQGIIYFVDKDPFHLALRHETMHALSWRLWGPPSSYWLSEGLAVYASGKCGNYPLHTLSHNISEQGKLAAFKSLTENFDFRALESSLQAASMVKFIYDEYGVTALKHFWKNGFKNTADGTGFSVEALEEKWKKHIALEKFDTDIDWERIKKNGCE